MGDIKIIFEGRCAPMTRRVDVKLALSKLYQVDVSAIEKFFNGGVHVLKQGLSEAQADRYLAVLEQTGMIVKKMNPVEFTELTAEAKLKKFISEPIAVKALGSEFMVSHSNASLPFEQDVEDTKVHFFTINRRLGRMKYCILYLSISFFLSFVLMILSQLMLESSSILFQLSEYFSFLLQIILLFLFSSQRLRDINKSLWWNVPLLSGYLVWVFPSVSTQLMSISSCSMLWITCSPSVEENDYGMPPAENSLSIKIIFWFLLIVWIGAQCLILSQYTTSSDFVKSCVSNMEKSGYAEYAQQSCTCLSQQINKKNGSNFIFRTLGEQTQKEQLVQFINICWAERQLQQQQ